MKKETVLVINKNRLYNQNIYYIDNSGNKQYYQIRPLFRGEVTINGSITKYDKDLVIVKNDDNNEVTNNEVTNNKVK